jgi:hypothetical protein
MTQVTQQQFQMLFDKQRQLEAAVSEQMAYRRNTENPTKCDDDHATLARMVQSKSFDILRTVTRTLTPDDVLRNYCVLMDIPEWQCQELHLPCKEDLRRSPVVEYIECVTGTRVGIVERRKSGMSTVQIIGTLISTYAAHTMLIQQLVQLPEEEEVLVSGLRYQSVGAKRETFEGHKGHEESPKAKEEWKPDDTGLRCYYCNNLGHRKKECRKWLNDKQDKEAEKEFEDILKWRAAAGKQEEKKYAKWAAKAAKKTKGGGQWYKEYKEKNRGDPPKDTSQGVEQ